MLLLHLFLHLHASLCHYYDYIVPDVSIHLSVEFLLVIISRAGHLSEQLPLVLRDSLIHTVQLKPSPVINDTFGTWRHTKKCNKATCFHECKAPRVGDHESKQHRRQ